MICDLMTEYSLTWDTVDYDDHTDCNKIAAFAEELLRKAQNVIDSAVTVTTDEYLAYKCPECHCLHILYKYDKFCPNCGVRVRGR